MELTNFHINRHPREVDHRLQLEYSSISGKTLGVWRLYSVDEDNNLCYTLVLHKPEDFLYMFSDKVKSEYNSFCDELNKKKGEWHFLHGTPTLKRVVRLYRKNEIFRHFNLQVIFYHFGAVPALVVGEIDGMKLALLPETFGRQGKKHKSTDEEDLEMLMSFEEFLPLMFHAYFEQIGNYFKSILYGASAEKVIHFCLRIRQILGGSIRSKIELIEDCSIKDGEVGKKASAVYEKYQGVIKEARAVDSFVHLLVNYIYRFYCIRDRVDHYHDKLKPLPSAVDLFAEDNISFIKRCAQNLQKPTDNFLKELYPKKNNLESWLYTFGETSAFIAEIVQFTENSFDCPTIFLTYHFHVMDSERFAWLLGNLPQPSATLLQGRSLGRNIRWSLLARVWFSDHHIFFLPHSWRKMDSTAKPFRPKEDWVMLELLYAQLIKKETTFIVCEPINEEIIDQFRKHIEDYTKIKEIPNVSDVGWDEFIEAAKIGLSQHLHTHKYLTCNLEKFDLFVEEYKKNITERAANHLIKIMFVAWCYWFEEEAWSVVQALIEMENRNIKNGPQYFTINEIVTFIGTEQKNNRKFEWIKKYDTSEGFKRAIYNYVSELKEFAFNLDAQPFYLLETQKQGKFLIIKLRARELYDKLIKKFRKSSNEDLWNEIISDLLRDRLV